MTALYPVFLNLSGRPCVVIGGGRVAEHKVIGLVAAGACVTVVSPQTTRRLAEMAGQGLIRLRRRPYRRGDLGGMLLAIAASGNQTVNREVWEEAQEWGVLLNAVDDMPHCSFITPAIYRQGSLTLAISTAGKSPALAAWLRDRLAGLIGPEYATFLDLLGDLRGDLAARVPDPARRAAQWRQIVESDAIEYIRRRDVAGARQRIAQLLGGFEPTPGTPEVPWSGEAVPGFSGSGGVTAMAVRGRHGWGRCTWMAVPQAWHRGCQPGVSDGGDTGRQGIVYLVGAGPGDPKLITVRGLEVLRGSDVIVYDRLVSPALLEEARPRAERIFVGKRPGKGSMLQEEISALLIERARAGLTVARLKGGDPFVFGRGGEECEALRAVGIRFEVVPGVTSAIAVPAFAGIPVTHRRCASAFAVVTGHECDGASDLDWEALARIPTLVVLMGLRALPEIALRLLAHGASPSTPAAVVANGTTPYQQTATGSLATIAEVAREAGLEPPATLVVGEVVRLREALRWFDPGAVARPGTDSTRQGVLPLARAPKSPVSRGVR